MDAGGSAADIPEELLTLVDIFSPNEVNLQYYSNLTFQTELERMVKRSLPTEGDLLNAAKEVQGKFPNMNILLKMGEKGNVLL